MLRTNPIGVFDSGLGGISVLRALKDAMPSESYIYFADKDNAPYGSKSDEQIMTLTLAAVKRLISLECKAIVIACNTATSVAAASLRQSLDVPIIGLEPAIKPAACKYPNGKILVLATPVTLSHEKFQSLLLGVGRERFTPIPVPYLVEYVEGGMTERAETVKYLGEIFKPYRNIKFDACVLGCTHFPFVKAEITEALGYETDFFDGAQGAANRLKMLLQKNGQLVNNIEKPYVKWNTEYPNGIHLKLLYNN